MRRGPAPAKATGAVTKKPAARPTTEYDPEDYDEKPVNVNGSGTEHIRPGWGASQEIIDSTSNYAQAFRPTKDTQIIKILEAKPYASFRRHWIDRVGIGKRAYVCLQSIGQDCPLCNVGDKPGAVTAFNIALLSDDGTAVVKSWDCGVKLTQQLKGYNTDPKIGPLDRPGLYFAVKKTEAQQRQQVTTTVNPVRGRDLLEDWQTPPLDDEQLAALMSRCYTVDIVGMTPRHEMEEIAAEITGDDVGRPKAWGDED
jgi:hypothetical protein